eukprot:GFUD01032492.1.p1 GENE.GFUD01032492.1~~GFUD01032492.1.p1  ORF type:complete len:262 (+),score=66.16 GFUD01032492.1:106-891(+)
MASQQAWHFEQVNIKDSEYAKKCGIAGECYFYVSKGHIKIAQLDNKTSLDLSVSRIRNWGATSKSFFLDLGSRSPAGAGRLEMTHKDPNTLRLLVRDTTSSKKHRAGGSETGGAEEEYNEDIKDEGNYSSSYADSTYADSGYGENSIRSRTDSNRGDAYSYSGGADSYHGKQDGYEVPGSNDSLNRRQKKNSKGMQDQLIDEGLWHKKDKVRSEESEGSINVRSMGASMRHVAVGEEMETYTVVKKSQPFKPPPLPQKKMN